ncbi:MAG: lipoprotein signal peptidase [Prevotella sp.]|nr:lipoprotein signal peptidase [Bacteroides sp.]MCM1365783.1 lipoprotein signal peptidase [Prevotella sp.]MCM1436525.1 lipoprotein signal peptidase [Prevotella sp.]
MVFIVVLAVLIADQTIKIWVKTHFYLGEDLEIFPWWHLKFIENNGMAFGMELGSKLLLTLGRILAVGVFIWYIMRVVHKPSVRSGFLVTCALITAGAAGNIFDCVFYGEIFNNPMPPEIAQLFPIGGGYSGWFEGRVVDMLYFPFFDFVWPEWVPIVGGGYFEFFQYIFNIADASICVGVFMLIVFYSNEFSESLLYLRARMKKS